MKKLIITSVLAALVAFGTTVMAQERPAEYLGLPGDNLNLYATMKLFQESETLEGFERNLNDENSRINNLDLNGDNLIDYITVSDYVDGNVHNIVLRAALNNNESQDVAVFTVEKFRDGSVQIQLVGDQDLYGKNYIIEPIYDETPNPGYTGNSGNIVNVTVVRTTPFEIAGWPMIRFIYSPNYHIWHSSWHWGYYPSYWNPWRPFFWDYYYGYHYNQYNNYYGHYRHWNQYRYSRYNDFYYSSIRTHSTQVRSRINEGQYKSTYSHPDQRKEGEALYSRTHSDQNTRTQGNGSVNSQGRKPVAQPYREGTTTRSTPGTTRQATPAVKEKSVSRPSSGQNTNVSRKSETTVNGRQMNKPTQVRTKEAAPRSAPPAYGKTNTKPAKSQSTQTTRTTRQSAPKASSAEKSSKRETKSSTSVRKSEKETESKNRDKSSRR